MELGVFANVNQAIDEEVAQRICANYGFRFEVEKRERGGGIVHAPVKKVELDIEDKLGGHEAARPGGDHHGARRPRQDHLAGRHSQVQRRGG